MDFKSWMFYDWSLERERKKNPWNHRRSDKNSSFSQNFVSWMLKLGNSSNKSRQVFSRWSFSKFLPWISRKTTSSPSSSEIKTCSTFRPNFSEFPLNSFPSSKDSPGAWKSLQIEKKKSLNYERWKQIRLNCLYISRFYFLRKNLDNLYKFSSFVV